MQKEVRPPNHIRRALPAAVLVVNLIGPQVFASPGDLDAVFNAGTFVTQPGDTHLAVQSDGKVIIAGAFTSINGISRNRIARLNPDGSLDNSFLNGLGGANSSIYAVALQPNGQVLISGAFTSVNGVTRNRIARLNSDGSLDNSFLNGLTGADDWVESIAVQSNGQILIGGYFTRINGTGRNLIARLNADGSLDGNFLNGMAGADNAVFAFALQNDGKILIGGAFTFLNGATRNYVARLNADGSVDGTFLNGLSGGDNVVNALALQSDGRVVVGGSFALINGVSRNRLARLNSDGSLDNTFLNGLSGANSHVYSLGLQSDGKLIVGGAFTSMNAILKNRLARLNPDGSLDGWFLNRLAGPNNFVAALALQTDGKVLLCGDFTSVNGVSRNQVARLLIDYSAPKMDYVTLDPGSLEFSFVISGSPGQTLVVQASTNLKTWTSLTTNVLSTFPPDFIDSRPYLQPQRWFRLMSLP